jgi:hypothetical protein
LVLPSRNTLLPQRPRSGQPIAIGR